MIFGLRANAGMAILSLRRGRVSSICSAGNEKARRSRGAGSLTGATIRGGTSGARGGRPPELEPVLLAIGAGVKGLTKAGAAAGDLSGVVAAALSVLDCKSA